MKAKVDQDICIGCGLCESICPEIFSLNDDGVAQAVEEEIGEDLLESATEARDSCPVECINIE
ncbi:MAG: ferredoxin [Peptococcaceae bacterium]|nr:ferredoxin [Peptococcaceae bacterium]